MSDPVIDIPFAAGLDQATRSELAEPSSGWESLRNVRQNRQGGASKRPGFEAITSSRLDGTTRTSGRRLMMNGQQICTIDDDNKLDAYSTSLDRFITKTQVPEAAYEFLQSPSIGNLGAVADIASVGKYIVVALQTAITLGAAGYAYACVIDADNGAILLPPEKLYGGIGLEHVRMATYGDTCILVAANTTDDTISAFYIDLTNATTIAAGWAPTSPSPVTSAYTGSALAFVGYGSGVVLAWTKASGTNRIALQSFTKSALVDSNTIDTSSVTPTVEGLDLSEAGGTLWIGWDQVGSSYIAGLDGTLSIISTQLLVTTSIAGTRRIVVASTGIHGVLLIQGTDAISVKEVATSTGATVSAGSTITIYNAFIQSRPFGFNSKLYAFFSSKNQEEIVLCEWTPSSDAMALHYLRPVCSPVVRGLYDPGLRARCRVATSGENTLIYGFLTKKTGTTVGATIIQIDFSARSRWQPTEHHNALWLSGGLTAQFDGERVFEAGFLCAPPKPIIDVSTSGSATLATGCRYVAVYAEVDAEGDYHISGVSNPTDSTGAITSKKIQVLVYPLSITARNAGRDANGTGLHILVFATEDGAEPPYSLIDVVKPNDPTTVLTFTDATSDGLNRSGALLYNGGNLPGTVVDGQPGGPQDHRAPPGLSFIKSYNGMLVGASGADVWYSGQPVVGEGTWFTPIFVQTLDSTITAIEIMDGSVIATTRRGIFVGSGEAPNDAGTQGGLGSFRRLSVDVGSIDGITLVTSKGLFFRSDRGVELLDRGLSVQFVGQKTQDELAACPIVSAMVVDTRNSLIRISICEQLSDSNLVSNAAAGRDLVYDLTLDTWVTDAKLGTRQDEDSNLVEQATQDAAMVFYADEWRYAWLATDGTVYIERLIDDDAAHLDGSAWVGMQAESKWVHIAGIQGEQFLDQMLMLLQRHTDHGISVEFAYDYVETFGTPRVYLPNEVAALSREWLVREIGQTTNTAIKVRLSDVEPDHDDFTLGNGKGATWIALTFSGAAHRGPKRSSAAQRGG